MIKRLYCVNFFVNRSYKGEPHMNKKLKSFAVAIFAAFAGLLGACTDTNTVTLDRASQMASVAAERAKAAEAAKTETKLNEATKEMARLAEINVTRGDFTKADNCRVDPSGLLDSQAAADFPHNFRGFYRSACEKAVADNVDAHKKANATAVANAKAKEKKIAAKRAKAEELAAKQPKRRHQSAGQPTRPLAQRRS